MAFELPPLPYAYDALQPFMSKETLEFHHDKHHQAYVTNGNKLLEGSGLEGKSLEEIVKQSYSKNAGLFNNAGQHYNHIHFWKWMKPNGGGNKIPGALCQARSTATSAATTSSRPTSSQAGAGQFGSGWCVAGVRDGKLEITKTPNGENPLVHGGYADSRLRRVGALLLHRLPQPPSRLSRMPSSTASSTGTMSWRCTRRRWAAAEPKLGFACLRAGHGNRARWIPPRLLRSATRCYRMPFLQGLKY